VIALAVAGLVLGVLLLAAGVRLEARQSGGATPVDAGQHGRPEGMPSTGTTSGAGQAREGGQRGTRSPGSG